MEEGFRGIGLLQRKLASVAPVVKMLVENIASEIGRETL